jgi:hypothetical protein
MREPPGITSPKRNALIKPRPVSPAFGGSRNVTCGMSTTTRYGSARVKTCRSILRLRSTTKRVWASSPPSRASVATGKESAEAGADAPAANAIPAINAPKKAKRTAWMTIGSDLIPPSYPIRQA